METQGRGQDGSLHAAAGDRLIVNRLHGSARDAEILAVRHPDGSPPYEVRWSDTGHEALVYPGPDAVVQHVTHPEDPSS